MIAFPIIIKTIKLNKGQAIISMDQISYFVTINDTSDDPSSNSNKTTMINDL